ncbi:MAG: electron transport complex subunit RsxB [Proteobacteria bacterium]|jgi:Na+-translocating ferredoxin:NAD+ oxidoreductase subunit B|nr:electron transport complex subunit RsxB [Pseudomonadota bacterium]MCG6936198.1 electron transport complex subunit RsxB [Pseudomonadota bacterium]
MLAAILILSVLAILFGLLLGFAAMRYKVEGDPIVDQIDAILPQTQCGQCGYPGCRPYAEAIARGEADINQCPPGGEAGIVALADLLGRDVKPLNDEHGEHKEKKTVVIIDEKLCIGCTLCIQACPVDAIVGAAKQMHTVIKDECTGCNLCIPPCPVDCIHIIPVEDDIKTWCWPEPEAELEQPPIEEPV